MFLTHFVMVEQPNGTWMGNPSTILSNGVDGFQVDPQRNTFNLDELYYWLSITRNHSPMPETFYPKIWSVPLNFRFRSNTFSVGWADFSIPFIQKYLAWKHFDLRMACACGTIFLKRSIGQDVCNTHLLLVTPQLRSPKSGNSAALLLQSRICSLLCLILQIDFCLNIWVGNIFPVPNAKWS